MAVSTPAFSSRAEISDSAGGEVVGLSFTAFGERRDASDRSGSVSAADKDAIHARDYAVDEFGPARLQDLSRING